MADKFRAAQAQYRTVQPLVPTPKKEAKLRQVPTRAGGASARRPCALTAPRDSAT